MAMQSMPVSRLRPTQIAVGKRLVELKRKDLRTFERRPQELVDYIGAHPIRVVLGPKAHVFIIDHHHLGCALSKEGFKTTPLSVEADYSALGWAAFWQKLQDQDWVHPFDGHGRKCAISKIPSSLGAMQDDPYRSLAGCVRLAGGFENTKMPYMEFLWADYFRPLVARGLLRADFAKALRRAKRLARAPQARHLPGYLGHGF